MDWKNTQSARVQIALAEIKSLNSLQIIKLGQIFLLSDCFAVLTLKEILDFFLFALGFLFFCAVYLCGGFCTVYIGYRWPGQCAKSFKNMISVHTLERTLML